MKPARFIRILFATVLAFLLAATATAAWFSRSQSQTLTEMKFVEYPTVLPPGPKVALVKGSYTEGQWMSMVKVPAGFVMPPHSHPDERTIIVVSGVLFQGEGEKVDEKALKAFPAGSVIIDPPKEPHYHLYKEDTVFIEMGSSPTAVNYVNPSDAPARR